MTAAGEPAALLLVAAAIGPWHRLSSLVWLAGAVVVASAAWAAGQAWSSAAGLTDRSWFGWAWAGLSLAVNAVILLAYPLLGLLR